jgi:hypothetical protein
MLLSNLPLLAPEADQVIPLSSSNPAELNCNSVTILKLPAVPRTTLLTTPLRIITFTNSLPSSLSRTTSARYHFVHSPSVFSRIPLRPRLYSFHCITSPLSMANTPTTQLAAEIAKAANDTRSETAQTTTSSGVKRKRGTELKFYAVRHGHAPGIYHSWGDCKAQITGFKKAICKWNNLLLEP